MIISSLKITRIAIIFCISKSLLCDDVEKTKMESENLNLPYHHSSVLNKLGCKIEEQYQKNTGYSTYCNISDLIYKQLLLNERYFEDLCYLPSVMKIKFIENVEKCLSKIVDYANNNCENQDQKQITAHIKNEFTKIFDLIKKYLKNIDTFILKNKNDFKLITTFYDLNLFYFLKILETISHHFYVTNKLKTKKSSDLFVKIENITIKLLEPFTKVLYLYIYDNLVKREYFLAKYLFYTENLRMPFKKIKSLVFSCEKEFQFIKYELAIDYIYGQIHIVNFNVFKSKFSAKLKNQTIKVTCESKFFFKPIKFINTWAELIKYYKLIETFQSSNSN